MSAPFELEIAVRTMSIGLGGLVVGASVIAVHKYWSVSPLWAWMFATIGVTALFQCLSRAAYLNAHTPLGWRDWGALLVQINALILITVMIKRRKDVEHNGHDEP